MKRYLGTFDLLKIRRDKEAQLSEHDETLKELRPIDEVEAAILLVAAQTEDTSEAPASG
jgi:hypothetical protein